MNKRMYVYAAGKPVLVTIRNYTLTDIEGMIAIQKESFPPPFPPELWWNEEQLREHVQRFPQGALCAEVDGQLIGSMTGLLVDREAASGTHSWEQITDSGYIRNHNPMGDTLYVVDLCVIPQYRQYGIGKWLMLTMCEVVVHLQLTRLLGGGRMPGYKRYADQLTAQEYLERITSGELKDPVLSFLLRCGRMPVGVAAHYLEDEDSCHYAALMEWRNPFLEQHSI